MKHNSTFQIKHILNIVTALLEFEREDTKHRSCTQKGKKFMFHSLKKVVFNPILQKFPTSISKTRSRNKEKNTPGEKSARLFANKGTAETYI
jgi:hypothetical protein